jgi:hypothetical protein
MGGAAVLEEAKKLLGIDEHGTTKDGKYSLVTEECLAGCDHAPCLLVNERLHKRVKPDDIAKILADANNAKIPYERSELFDAPRAGAGISKAKVEELLESTSDVREMKEAD